MQMGYAGAAMKRRHERRGGRRRQTTGGFADDLVNGAFGSYFDSPVAAVVPVDAATSGDSTPDARALGGVSPADRRRRRREQRESDIRERRDRPRTPTGNRPRTPTGNSAMTGGRTEIRLGRPRSATSSSRRNTVL